MAEWKGVKNEIDRNYKQRKNIPPFILLKMELSSGI